MLQGLVGGLVEISMSLTKLSSRLDFFFFIVYLPVICLLLDLGVCVYMLIIPMRLLNYFCLVGDNNLDVLLSFLLDNIYIG